MTGIAEECACGALRIVPPHSPETVARPPKRRFVECPTCRRFAVDYEMIAADAGNIEAASRFQLGYYIDPKTSAKTSEEVEYAKSRLDQPWNASCVSIIEEALARKAGVFDLGACAGAFLTVANRLELPVEKYVG